MSSWNQNGWDLWGLCQELSAPGWWVWPVCPRAECSVWCSSHAGHGVSNSTECVLAASLHLLLCSNQYFHFQCCFLSFSGRTILLDDQLCLFKKHCKNLLYVDFWHFNIYFSSGLAEKCMLTTCTGFMAVAPVLLKRETLQFLFIILFLVFIFQLFLILSILAFYLNVFSINLK